MSDDNQAPRPRRIAVSVDDYLRRAAFGDVTIDPERNYLYKDTSGTEVHCKGVCLLQMAEYYANSAKDPHRAPRFRWLQAILQGAGTTYIGWLGFALPVPREAL